MRFEVLLTFGLIFWTQFAFADDQMPQPPKFPKPDLHLAVGDPVTATWPDGRQAQLMAEAEDVFSFPIHGDISDNNCSQVRGVSCQFDSFFRRVKMSFVWLKNPIATDRVGKVIEGRLSSGDAFVKVESDYIFLGLSDRYEGISFAQDIPGTNITCENFLWLPQASQRAPEFLRINTWSAEQMFQNPETGVNENMTVGGAFDVYLQKTSEQTLKFQSLQSVFHYFTNPLLFFATVSTMTLPTPEGGSCEVQFKPSIKGDVPAKEQPAQIYIYDAHGLATLNRFFGNYALNSLKAGYEVQ